MAPDLLDVEHVEAVAHGEVDRLVRCLVEILHEGQCRFAQAHLDRNQFAELEHGTAQHETFVRPVEQALGEECIDESVCGRLGQISTPGNVREGLGLSRRAERLQNVDPAFEHVDT